MRFVIDLAIKNLKRRRHKDDVYVAGIMMGVWLTLAFLE